MNFLFFLFMLMFTVFVYIVSRKNFFSPGVIICSVFALSSFFVVINGKNWKYDISYDAFIYLVLAVSTTLIGIFLGTKVNISMSKCAYKSNSLVFNEIKIRDSWIIINLLCLFILYRYFQHQYNLSVQLGNTAGIPGMIFILRMNVYDEEVFRLGNLLNIGISFLRASGYISLFVIVDSIIGKKRFEWRCIIPVCTLVLYFVLTTGRGGFIGFTCAIMFYVYYSLKRKGKLPKPRKMLRYVVLSFSCFIILFWQLGKLTGKNSALNIWDTLSIYIGSSILCFDKFLKDTNSFNFWGVNTFRGINGIFAKFGLKVPETSNHVEKIRWEGYSSNVYTAFYPYYKDYGPIVSFIIIFLVAFIIGIFWRKFQKDNNNLIMGVIYGRIIAVSVAMYSIAERMLSNVIALNSIVEIFFIALMIKKYSRKSTYNKQKLLSKK